MEDLRRAVIRIDATEIESLRAEVTRLAGELTEARKLCGERELELQQLAERSGSIIGAMAKDLQQARKLCGEALPVVDYFMDPTSKALAARLRAMAEGGGK
jgi:hypothetical protein